MDPPPPRRSVPSSSSSSSSTTSSATSGKPTWKEKAKASGRKWGIAAAEKAVVYSDKAAPYINGASEKFGGERFWPASNDFPQEVDKCVRILRAFTVDGVAVEGKGLKKQGKVFQKIPVSIIADAKGILVYASQRMGASFMGGSGGSGLLCAKLPNGEWSAPSAIMPGNITGGLMFGIDLFEAVIVIRTDAAMREFYRHSVTLGGELSVSAGHWGAGSIAEAGKEKAVLYSYVRSRGFYAGIEAFAQVWLARFDENERVYGTVGATQKEILTGHFKPTPDSLPFLQALREAETGYAQRLHGADQEFVQTFETKDAGLPAYQAAKGGESSINGALDAPPPPPPRRVSPGTTPPISTDDGSAPTTPPFLAPLLPPPRRGTPGATTPVVVEQRAAVLEETPLDEHRGEEKAAEGAGSSFADLGPPPALPTRAPPMGTLI